MPATLMPLGLFAGDFANSVAIELLKKGAPIAKEIWNNPGGMVKRLGDLLIWQSAGGQHVIATLESASETQTRIEQVVTHIESAQVGISHSLGALTSLSMFGFGFLSLSSGFMIWRMNALNQRFKQFGQQLSDIGTQLTAQQQAHLKKALDFLHKHEGNGFDPDLHTALEESVEAQYLYQCLVQQEATGPKRLAALNLYGRYYLLALSAHVRCLVLRKELKQAEHCIADESSTLNCLAKTTFDEVLGLSPERYLDPALAADNITLATLAEVYQQAQQIGATESSLANDASDVFERLRPAIYGAGRGWFGLQGQAKISLITNLRYLMACLEEVARIESLRLRIALSADGKLSFEELRKGMSAFDALNRKSAFVNDVAVFGLC